MNTSNHTILNVPVAKQIAISTGCNTVKWNKVLNAGMLKTVARNTIAPPTTHFKAGLGLLHPAIVVDSHERLARISPRFARTSVVKVRLRASISPRSKRNREMM